MNRSDAISRVSALEILNFRGDPTVQAEVVLADGSRGRGAVPAGVSVGSGEAEQLLDGDATRLAGRGVLKAVRNVREIIGPALIGIPASRQEAIDRKLIEMDGTPGISIDEEMKRHNTSPVLWKLENGVMATPSISLVDLTVALVMGRNG